MSTSLQKTKQIRILARLHYRLKVYAAENKTSITKLITDICADFFEKQKDVDQRRS